MSATRIPQNTATFSVEELVRATGGQLVGEGTEPVRGVVTDTREDGRDKVFVALRGERFDGHHYLGTAIANGARVVVVEDEVLARRVTTKSDRVVALVVPDTLRALGDLARFHRDRHAIPVIGIAGAAGKTTTRAVAERLLTAIHGEGLLATRGNLNNRIGVPMTLLGLTPRHTLGLLELGTNAPGEVAELCRIARPTAGVLTLIDLEHTEGLGDLEGVEEEEASLYRALVGPGTIALGNLDDERVARRLRAAPSERKYGYGTAAGDLVALRRRVLGGPELSRFEVSIGGREAVVETSLLGRPGTLALLAAMTLVEALEPGRLDGPFVTRVLTGLVEEGRGRLFRLEREILLVDDSYNSNPASLRESLRTGAELAAWSGGRLFAVVGEMRELGALSGAAHAELAETVVETRVARLDGLLGDARILVEEAAQRGVEAVFHATVEGVGRVVAPLLEPKDVVVVKASRGVRAESVVAEVVEAIGLSEGSATSVAGRVAVGSEDQA